MSITLTQKCNSVIDFGLVALVLVSLSLVTVEKLVLIKVVLCAVVLFFPIKESSISRTNWKLNATTVMMYRSADENVILARMELTEIRGKSCFSLGSVFCSTHSIWIVKLSWSQQDTPAAEFWVVLFLIIKGRGATKGACFCKTKSNCSSEHEKSQQKLGPDWKEVTLSFLLFSQLSKEPMIEQSSF